MGRGGLGPCRALTVAVLMGCAWQQTSYWRNCETLDNRALDCSPSDTLGNRGEGFY